MAEIAQPPSTLQTSPARATQDDRVLATPGEYRLDHLFNSSTRAFLYVWVQPKVDAYFDGNGFELRLTQGEVVRGMPVFKFALRANQRRELMIEFPNPANASLANATLIWQYRTQP